MLGLVQSPGLWLSGNRLARFPDLILAVIHSSPGSRSKFLAVDRSIAGDLASWFDRAWLVRVDTGLGTTLDSVN